MVKLIICAKRKTWMTRKEFDAYWQNQHGPLVKSVPEFMRHVRKYVQCHILANSAPLGAAAPYDGVAELRWDTRDDFVADMKSEASRAGNEDLANFTESFGLVYVDQHTVK